MSLSQIIDVKAVTAFQDVCRPENGNEMKIPIHTLQRIACMGTNLHGVVIFSKKNATTRKNVSLAAKHVTDCCDQLQQPPPRHLQR